MRKLLAALCSVLTLHAFAPSGVVVGPSSPARMPALQARRPRRAAAAQVPVSARRAQVRRRSIGGRSSSRSSGRAAPANAHSGQRRAGLRATFEPASAKVATIAPPATSITGGTTANATGTAIATWTGTGMSIATGRRQSRHRSRRGHRQRLERLGCRRLLGGSCGGGGHGRGGRVVGLLPAVVLRHCGHPRAHLPGLQRRLVCAQYSGTDVVYVVVDDPR